jgi:hypothetical protein
MGGPSAVVQSCLCPVLALKADSIWLYSALIGAAETISPLRIEAEDCLVYPAIIDIHFLDKLQSIH